MATLIVVEDLAAPASAGRGGLAMYLLQWLRGLESLGHEVYFFEFLAEDPGEGRTGAVRYFGEALESFWRNDRAALLIEKTGESLYGLSAAGAAEVAGRAAAVVTIAAHYRREPYPLLEKIRPRILIEQDPGYTHLWADGGDPADVYGEHDFYFTVGGNVGSPRCALPTLGLRWRPVWNPVVLDWWPAGGPVRRDRFTTVADWRGYGYLEFGGQVLGPKAEEFRKFIDLPRRAGEAVEIALAIDADDPDRELLQSRGWLVESTSVASTAAGYQDYVSGSLGEFSCVKGGYAGTHCGWFSDRSACYLAAGRPVVLQATGFADLLPTGRGLFSVAGVDEAAEALRAVRRDYALHSAAARALAEEFFDATKVAGRLLAEAGVGGARPWPTTCW
jgi:hypothetical protein